MKTAWVQIRDCVDADRDAAIDVLTKAFLDAPDVQIMVGAGPAAADRLRRMSAMAFDPGAKIRIVVAERQPRVLGVLTFADLPDCTAMNLRQAMTLLRIVGPRVFGAARLFMRTSRVHPRTSHRHLPQLAVDPAAQGQGIGKALMADFCRRCDEAGLPGYLETYVWSDTSRPSLRRFYEAFGFTTIHEVPMGATWTGIAMLRPPAS
ncbi:MAG TPA: GNAT family N-acetyltransferase [Candidatus Limnocylindrales bacterium]|nr:GNAT family N-acetyltransferase [Candidatus Limnocylindrales bacterium]